MEKFATILTFVFLLITAVQYCSCERFNIIPTADSPCPGEFTGEPCLTLQQYVANPSLSSNITLELHSGNHRLDSQLSAANINSFTMRTNATVTVNCSQQLQLASYDWFRFDRVQQFHVSGITFIGCRIYLNYVTNVTITRNSFLNRTICCSQGSALNIRYSSSVLIKQCNISDNKVSYGAISGFRINSFIIDQCSLVNNYGQRYTYGSGSALYLVQGNVTIRNSNFSDNRGNYGYNGGAVYVTAQNVSIYNTQFNNNRASSAGGAAYIYIYTGGERVNITNTNFTNNSASGGNGGAAYISNTLEVEFKDVYFINNTAGSYSNKGGAVYVNNRGGSIALTNAYFCQNMVGLRTGGLGGAIYISKLAYIRQNVSVTISKVQFNNNTAGINYGYGGAIYVANGQDVNIFDSNLNNNTAGINSGNGGALHVDGNVVIVHTNFTNNRAGFNGGAVYFNGRNITFANIYFINNTAINGGGGALNTVERYTNITLTYNTFSYNTAAYCGVMDIDEFYHYHVNFIGNTFTYNRAVGLVAGNNGGGVICIRNASISLMDNNFSHNTATGDAGVIRVDESDVTVQRSIFSNNTAGGDGGVFHTYFYPSTYTISHSSFTDNQAGGDGGVMYVGRASSHVDISQSMFTFNNATNRGGVLAVIGTTVRINGATISDNTAQLGEVVSACNSNVTISDPQLSPTQDPVYSFCSLYDSSNETVSRTTPQTPSITDTTTNPLTETATTTQQDSITTTLSPPDEATSNQPTTITTTRPTTAATTNEQTTTPTFTTTEDSVVAMTTTMEDMSTTSTPTTNQITADITTEDGDVTMTTTALEETTTAAMPQTTEITTTDDTVDTTETIDTTSPSTETMSTTDDHMTSTSQLPTTPYEMSTTTNTETMTEPSVSDVTTKSDVIITSSDELPKETTSTNTDTSTTMSPTADLLPKQETTTVVTNEEETSTRYSKTDSSDSIPTTVKIVTKPADKEQDATQYNPHYIIPGYVAIGVSVVLLVIVVVVIFKTYRVKSEPQPLNRFNLSENTYPTLKNEYTLPDVHVLST